MGNLWDKWASPYTREQPASSSEVAYLAALGGMQDKYLDLGCGTGRVARVLAPKVHRIDAVDSSDAMIEEFRAATPPANVATFVDDMTLFGESEDYDVAYCVRSTLFSLTEQDLQLSLFRNAHRVLKPGGHLVVQCYLPSAEFLFPAKSLSVRSNSVGKTVLSVTSVDRCSQHVLFNEIEFADTQPVTILPVQQRYLWPSEMDLMARASSLELIQRTADFSNTVFNHNCPGYVSLYSKA
ncbi:class I SAM-dependent DNA methyltransferase [Nocardia gipuzkoensis]